MALQMLRIIDCYGETAFVSADDFATAKHMISLRTRDGRYIEDMPDFRRGDATMIAVGNIEEVEAC